MKRVSLTADMTGAGGTRIRYANTGYVAKFLVSARTKWRLLPLLCLAACSQSGVCQLSIATDIPVRLEQNRLLVASKVNGVDTTLLVDSGSYISIITTETVAALKLPRNQLSVRRMIGVGGDVSNADVPNCRLRLWQASGCGIKDLPSGAWRRVKLQRKDRNGLLLSVAIDGHPLTAQLDTGASQSLLKTDSASELGVSAATLAKDPTATIVGVDGHPISAHVHRFDILTIEGDSMASPAIGVSDFDLRSADMLLGMNYLRTRRVWISYRNAEMFVQTPAS